MILTRLLLVVPPFYSGHTLQVAPWDCRLFLERKGIRPTWRGPIAALVPGQLGILTLVTPSFMEQDVEDSGPAGPVSLKLFPVNPDGTPEPTSVHSAPYSCNRFLEIKKLKPFAHYLAPSILPWILSIHSITIPDVLKAPPSPGSPDGQITLEPWPAG